MSATQPLLSIGSVAWIRDLYRLTNTALKDNAAQVHQKILQHLVAGFSARSGCLALREENATAVRIVAGIALPAEAIGSLVQFGEGVLGHVAKEATPLLLDGDLSNDPRFKKRKARTQTGTPQSAMCWPLMVEGRMIGVLSINSAPGAHFGAQHLQQGAVVIDLASMVIENAALQARRQALLKELQEAHAQLLQSEKMASVGQLAAGIAHEINNPIGYVTSNLGSLQRYLEEILSLLAAYEKLEPALPAGADSAALHALKKKLDLDFLRQDALTLLGESLDGVKRVRKIVTDLKEFSHVDSTEWQQADLHQGLDSTLNIAQNELKYKANVVRQYGELPLVECLASQMNQVFMNMLVNAAQAIETRGTITLRTGRTRDEVWVEIADTGKGIAPEHLKRIYDPFFTTKPVGQGTGLGLSLSYGIVQKHKGRIEVQSTLGKGTAFRVWLPVRRPAELAQKAHERSIAA